MQLFASSPADLAETIRLASLSNDTSKAERGATIAKRFSSIDVMTSYSHLIQKLFQTIHKTKEPFLSESRPIVLVTGSSGFVGRNLVPVLARGGWAVRRALRRPSGSDDEVLIDSIGPLTDWRAALDGAKAVVHLAARVHHPSEKAAELYRSTNTEGTLQLARCAVMAGVQQLIFVSTVLVHGRSNDGRAPFCESDILTPRGVYGVSKAAAEAGLEALAQDSDICVTIIRSPLVYGAGAKGNFKLLVNAVKSGIPLPFAAIRNQRAFLSVENLSSFILHRLSHAGSKFDVFLVADSEQVSTPEFIERLAKALGVKSRLFPIPTSILKLLLKVSGRQEAVDSLIGSFELTVAKAAATGWRPAITMDEGLRRATSGEIIES
jgi:UDP-glucose 4-epimerase